MAKWANADAATVMTAAVCLLPAQDHFDLSVWAFEKLADMKWGVISIQYRQVDCGYQPYKKASGTSWPGEFPPMSQAKDKDGGYYYQLSASDFVGKIGKGK
jgi:hypothetical protein